MKGHCRIEKNSFPVTDNVFCSNDSEIPALTEVIILEIDVSPQMLETWLSVLMLYVNALRYSEPYFSHGVSSV